MRKKWNWKQIYLCKLCRHQPGEIEKIGSENQKQLYVLNRPTLKWIVVSNEAGLQINKRTKNVECTERPFYQKGYDIQVNYLTHQYFISS